MDITKTLNRVKRSLGLKYSNLPIKDEDLIEVIIEESLPTFSLYFPYIIPMPFKLGDSKPVPHEKYGYYIDTSLLAKDMNIVAIENVTYNYRYSAFGDRVTNSGSAFDFIGSMVDANLDGACNIPIVWTFRGPNQVIFDDTLNYYHDELTLHLAVTHNPSLATIPESYVSEFINLILLDIKLFIYNNFRFYDNIDSPFGQINLKIEDWNNAAGDRETLIQKWNESYVYGRRFKVYNA